MAKKEKTIPNWTIFGTHLVSLEIHQFAGDKEKVFQLAVTIFLDDSTPFEKDSDKQLTITIYTDKTATVLDDLIYDGAIWAGQVFQNIGNTVFVIDEDGNIAKQIELDAFIPQASSKRGKIAGKSKFAN
jgi:hypothetical protein